VNVRFRTPSSGRAHGRTSAHQRPTGGSLATQPPPVYLGSTARPAPARSEPPVGLTGLPARLLARTPETAPAGCGASSAAARRPCTLRPAAGASPARGPCWTTRQGRRRRLARPCGALQQPRWPGRPPRRLPRQHSAAASRPPRGGLSACGVRQAGSQASVEVRVRGWCSVWPVTVMLVRVSRWLGACACTAHVACARQSAPRSDLAPLTLANCRRELQ